MNNGSHAGLRLAARASEPECPPEDEDEPEDGEASEGKTKKEKCDMDKTHTQADVEQAASAASAAANERFGKVLASDQYAGRESLAHKLLGNAALGADDIIDALASAPKAASPAPEAGQNAAEEAGRQVMRDALAEAGNSNVSPDGGAGGSGNAEANIDALWDTAYARVAPRKVA